MFTFNKALVSLGVGIVVWVLSQFGVTESMSVREAVASVVTAVGVYFVANKKG